MLQSTQCRSKSGSVLFTKCLVLLSDDSLLDRLVTLLNQSSSSPEAEVVLGRLRWQSVGKDSCLGHMPGENLDCIFITLMALFTDIYTKPTTCSRKELRSCQTIVSQSQLCMFSLTEHLFRILRFVDEGLKWPLARKIAIPVQSCLLDI